MSKKIQLQIPEPCHEDWDRMTPVDKGRFCDSCQKAVIDFTGMSDAQLVAFFKKQSTGSVCGKFFDDQLNRDYEIQRKRIPWLKYFFQFTIPIFLISLKTQAQGITLKASITPSTCNFPAQLSGTVGMISHTSQKENIAGLIVDENNNPVPYASVFIKGTKEGAMSDSTGIFNLKNPTDETKITLTISYIGYSTIEKQINIRKDDFTKIKLAANASLNGEVVVTSYGSIKLGGVMGGVTFKRSYLQKVKDYFTKDSVNVFPNPAKTGDEIKIEWKKAGAGECAIELFNIQGQLIKTSAIKVDPETNFVNFHLPLTTPGSYILRIRNKTTGKSHSEKIIIL